MFFKNSCFLDYSLLYELVTSQEMSFSGSSLLSGNMADNLPNFTVTKFTSSNSLRSFTRLDVLQLHSELEVHGLLIINPNALDVPVHLL